MPTQADIAHALRELRQRCVGEVLDDRHARGAYAGNFGGMLECTPAIVMHPVSAQDVLQGLRIAAQCGLSVTTRGAGHCQSALALGRGLVMDLRRFDRIVRVDRERRLVEAEPGASWQQVIEATSRFGLLPVGLGQIVETTLAGTLSVAGIGGESFRAGPQVDAIAYLDVATIDGEVRRCDAHEHRELFDAMRAGLGQCGVIVNVGYELRACATHLTSSGFVYRDAERMLRDAYALSVDAPVGRWLTSTLVSDPFSATRRALMLWVGQEHGDGCEPPGLPPARADFAMRPGQAPLWAASGQPGHPFFHQFGAATPERVNPWVEQLLPFEAAAGALEMLLDAHRFDLGSGSAGVRWIRRRPGAAPLFVTPQAELSVGLGIFASFASSEREAAKRSALTAAELLGQHGGMRYLSGYMVRTHASWREHYGGAWGPFYDAKRRYDPNQLLNPGFIEWRDG